MFRPEVVESAAVFLMAGGAVVCLYISLVLILLLSSAADAVDSLCAYA